MRLSQLKVALASLIRQGLPVFLWGAPGVGKTDAVGQVAADMGADFIVTHPAVTEPTDWVGLPMPSADGKTAEFRPFGVLLRFVEAVRLTIVLLDDLGQAVPSVQAAIMQLVLGRRVGSHVISEHVRFVACSNRADDKAGVQRMLTPLLNRAVHLDVDVSHEDWLLWALQAGVDPDIRAYISWKPGELLQFEAGEAQRARAFATPRSWAMLSRALTNLPDDLVLPVAVGTVGEGSGTGFVGFRKIKRSLPDPKRPLRDPAGATVPDDPGALYAQLCVLIECAAGASKAERSNIALYCNRVGDEPGTFCVLGCQAREPKFLETDGGKAWLKDHKSLVIAASTTKE
jgi:hypothetical protein